MSEMDPSHPEELDCRACAAEDDAACRTLARGWLPGPIEEEAEE